MKFEDVSYEDLEDGLRDLPMTWYPALLLALVRAAYGKGVFIFPHGASQYVRQVEDHHTLDIRT